LLGFTPESISQQNTRISSALTSHPLDAQLHQQAALLLSLFALRESAACFNDLRPALNRISAHLAIASAINGKAEYGAPGKLAEIALMTMGGHEAEAVRRIDSLMSSFSSDSATNDSVRSWLRALKIRATHDYRIADLKKASALERLEYGRALADDVGSDYLTEYLQKNKPEGNAIDWLRIGSRGVSTVESGHIYTEPAVQAEFQSFAQDFKLFKNKSIGSSTDANEALDLAPDRCLIADQIPRLQVISWADVAAFHARHILDSWFQKYYFEEKHWGVHEDAQNFAKYVDKTFSKLKLYPLFLACRLWVDVKTGTPEQTAAYKELMDASPQEINSTLWHRILLTSANAGALPKVDSWFTPRFLYGTAFDFNSRNWEQDPDVSMAELDRLKSESPYDSALLRNWAGTKYPHDTFTSAQIKEAYGVQAEVNVAAMEMVAWASRSNPATYAELMEKVAEYKPDKYFELGDFYVEHKQFDKAKIAYEAGVKLGRDDVLKSNSCSWLVNYYYDHGRKDEALRLATFAADVYSSSGLTTMAKLCERMGKFSEAEKYFLAIQERYNDSFGLCLFYRRHADNKDYKQKGDVLEKNIFPEGLKKVDITNIKEAPDTGILITVGGDLTEKYGLKVKEIIVAVNGIQVKTREQYHYMLNASPGTKMQFVVWNGNAYRTLEADLPDRRWGCQIRAYHPKYPKQEN
jgi:tetratricopeptide (TPR) repeat protein